MNEMSEILHHNAAAVLIVSRFNGTAAFDAEHVELHGTTITARGRWRRDLRLGVPREARSYSWPARRVLEVRWHDAGPVAA